MSRGHRAAGDISTFVQLGAELDKTPPRVADVADDLMGLFPESDTAKRLAQNYAMPTVFSQIVSILQQNQLYLFWVKFSFFINYFCQNFPIDLF